MKCYYTYDVEVGKVLIPGCLAVAHSGDRTDCTCEISFKQFEKAEYNEFIKDKNIEIKDLQAEVVSLNRIIKKLLKRRTIG